MNLVLVGAAARRWGVFLVAPALLGSASLSRLQASDIVLVNGRIYTANPAAPWAQALAISGSRIVSVGTNGDIMRWRGPHTALIDVDQRTVIPGIVDSHTHLWLGAVALHGFNFATPELYLEPDDEERLVAAIKAYAADHPTAPVLYGRVPFGNDVTHALLDRAVPDRPVVIHAPTEHTLWINGRALALAGIADAPLADPLIERFIVRDATGRPTGVIREAAMELVEVALPKPPADVRAAWLREAARYMNRYGITSVTNATGSRDEIRLYAALRDRGELTVRTRTAFGAVGVGHRLTPQWLDDLENARRVSDDRWVSANLVKFFADGAGGPLLYEPSEYRQMVRELDRRGYQIMTHALSPAAARLALDAYEQALRVNGPRDRRFRLEHAISVSPQDVPRAAALGVTLSMQPDFCCFADSPNAPTNVWQTFLKTGARLAFGSDWPCTFPPDPFGGIQQSVMRAERRLFTAPNPVAPRRFVTPYERLTVEQAVDAYTRAAAYARFSEEYLGVLEPGKEADLVVLSQDIFAVRHEEIGNTQAVMTMVGGRIVFNEMR